MGTQLPSPKRGRTTNFRPVYCDQMAKWIKMPFGREVGLSVYQTTFRWHIYNNVVLDGNPAPPRKGHSTPSFRPMSIMTTVAHLSYC